MVVYCKSLHILQMNSSDSFYNLIATQISWEHFILEPKQLPTLPSSQCSSIHTHSHTKAFSHTDTHSLRYTSTKIPKAPILAQNICTENCSEYLPKGGGSGVGDLTLLRGCLEDVDFWTQHEENTDDDDDADLELTLHSTLFWVKMQSSISFTFQREEVQMFTWIVPTSVSLSFETDPSTVCAHLIDFIRIKIFHFISKRQGIFPFCSTSW